MIRRNPNLQKISFVGHSLGGLICRYAIARLYQPQTNTSQAPSASTVKGSENLRSAVLHGGRIAGLEPMSFITFATPHLGCRGHNQVHTVYHIYSRSKTFNIRISLFCFLQVPMFGGSYVVEKAASTAAGILGRSGKHLFLTDNPGGKPPLLLQMSRDCEDLKFM